MDAETFESHRPSLLALAYRMLGDMARAEDMIQEAWVRWQNRTADVDAPKAFLITTVTHLCLDELGSARARHEESRSDRLPEPVDLEESGIGRVEMLDQISMAFLVLLQRLTPAERAVFLLHEVFDMSHGEIAGLLGKNEVACRQLLRRARENVAVERRVLETSRDEHRRLLLAFVGAVTSGEQERLLELLAEDAVLITDGGPNGTRYGRLRNTRRPVVGRLRIAAVLNAFARQDESAELAIEERQLNGEPAIVAFRGGRAIAAILVSVDSREEGGRIRHVFVQIDADRLQRLGPLD
ncbi:MAG: sigma-70 family RNA polymerase sigma factor [Polyangiales bacterium]